MTAGFVSVCGLLLALSGGLTGSLGMAALLTFGAKATPLLLDRGETYRLVTANFLHRDLLHFAFNAFAIWNVGGALELAAGPSECFLVLVSSALGTTLFSAVGADSISLGASGIAFGLLGASASFGWRQGVRGRMRAFFGLRLIPWMAALFAAGLGSTGVDNWGHAGGLCAGVLSGLFLVPRGLASPSRFRHAMVAASALVGTMLIGQLGRSVLPILGTQQPGPAGSLLRVPVGWRPAGLQPTRASFTNALPGAWRSSASVWFLSESECRAPRCTCGHLQAWVSRWAGEELGNLADVGTAEALQWDSAQRDPLSTGMLRGSSGAAAVAAACRPVRGGMVIVVALAPDHRLSSTVASKLFDSVHWLDEPPDPAPRPPVRQSGAPR